ncbi:MAG: arylsulfotransferase family protein [Planctomycetaceae bacterium]
MRMESLLKGLFAFSAAMLCFGWGLLTHRTQIFPYRLLKEAELAVQLELKLRNQGANDDDWRAWLREHPTPLASPQARFLSRRTPSEPILLACADLSGEPRDGRRELVRIVDRKGYALHTWSANDAWLRQLATSNGIVLRDESIVYACGAAVDDAGNLLVSMQTHLGFPYGATLVRMDRESNPQWSAPRAVHHWFSVADDGSVHAAWHEPVKTPLVVSGSTVEISSPSGRMLNDGIVKLSPRGEILDQFSLLEVLSNSDLAGLLVGTIPDIQHPAGGKQVIHVQDEDPLHLNDVQVICQRHLPSRPGLEQGDLLVSLRTPSVLAVISPQTRTVKWHSTRNTLFQHSPRLLPDGVLAFDNLGGRVETGGTRLVLVDLLGGPSKTLFPRPGQALPESFYSVLAGHVDVHPDGTRALVASTAQGVVWEVDLTTGEVLWEYIAPESNQRPTARLNCFCAKYCHAPQWLPGQVAATTLEIR